MKQIYAALLACAFAAACAGNTPQPEVEHTKREPLIDTGIDDGGTGIVGPAAGLAIGAAIGSGGGRKAAMIAGALIGYSVGTSEGPAVTGSAGPAYRGAIRRLMEAEVGEKVNWAAPGEKASGTLWVTDEFQDESGRLCRNFQEDRQIRGRKGHFSGTACPAS